MFDRIRHAGGLLRHGALLWTALLGATLPGAGCVAVKSGFECTTNGQCITPEAQQGICEATSYCSFPDPDCDGTKRRYGDASAELSNVCVAPPAEAACIQQMSAGGRQTCVVKTDGTLWCWGDNSLGQLGDETVEPRTGPVQVKLPANTKVTEVSGGIDHTCALTDGGDVYCWGDNAKGQLGVVDASGNALDGGGTPRKVEGLPLAKTLSAGGKHTCVVGQDSSLWCFGENAAGQLGDGTSQDQPAPVQVADIPEVESVQNGDEHTCALTISHQVWCWGNNELGQLGTKDTTSSLKPVAVIKVSVKQLGAGDEHTCALRDDSSLLCWGYNGMTGCVGNGSEVNQTEPLKILSAEHIGLSGGAFHSCAITDVGGGQVLCWGQNEKGQIGDGTAEGSAPTPAKAKLVTATSVIVGGDHSCATTADGTLWCWGGNTHNQLLLGSDKDRSSEPVRVPVCP